MQPRLKFLLLQVRQRQDPMRQQEVRCFARALAGRVEQIIVHDLLIGAPPREQLAAVDVVLIGGSGDFSVVSGGQWLEGALTAMRQLAEMGKPTFGSCWGFQGMARALGGRVVTDLKRAELGTIEVTLTPAGKSDPVFGQLPSSFMAQIGHQDIVDELPAEAVRLASSVKVVNEAYRLAGRPIYCTQFHPELDRASIVGRIKQYPAYAQKILGLTVEEFIASLRGSPEADKLLLCFIDHVFPREAVKNKE